jgi:predicted AAA+ superfamily ATPase
MIERNLQSELIERLRNASSVALLGPRQVGKTTLAFAISESIPSVYLDLEDSVDLQKAQNIAAFHRENRDKLIILDEVQRLPEVFREIRGLIDAERRRGNKTGHFLFLGSASIDLLRQSSESLAGRISYLELFPVCADEFLDAPSALNELNRLWLRGGFPESLLSVDNKSSLRWRRDFIKTYLERDVPIFGPRIPAVTLERLWTMLAHSQGTNINLSKLGTSLEISNVSVSRYVDLLADLLLIRKLQPYTANIKKRLVRSPRVYVRDSGITHALLNIGDLNELLGHPIVGKSWEGFVLENIMSVMPFGAEAFYFRTAGGAEIDILLTFGGEEKWAIEVKRSPAAALARGFHEACNDIKPARKIVVHAEADSYSTNDDIEIKSLYDLMVELKAK